MFKQFKKLVFQSSIYSFCEILIKILSLLVLLPIYTHFLTPSDYGILATMGALASLLFYLFNLGLPTAFTRFYYEYRESDELKTYIFNLLAFVIIAGLVLIAILQFLGPLIFPYLVKENGFAFDPYVELTILGSFFGIFLVFPQRLYRNREQPFRYLVLTISNFVCYLIAIIYFVVCLRRGALGGIEAKFYIAILFFVVSLTLLWPDIKLNLNFKKIVPSLKFSLPLIPAAVAVWALDLIDRFILVKMVDLSQVGIYSLGYTLGMGMYYLTSAFLMGWQPFFYNKLSSGSEDSKAVISRFTTYFFLVLSFSSLLLILFSREIVILLAAEKFYQASLVMPLIVLAYTFHAFYAILSTGITYVKKTVPVMWINWFVVTLNIILNLLLVPKFSIFGAAYATLISYLVLGILGYWYCMKVFAYPLEKVNLLKATSLLLVLSGGSVFLQPLPFFIGIMAKIILIGLFVGGVAFLNIITKEEIAALWKRMARRAKTA